MGVEQKHIVAVHRDDPEFDSAPSKSLLSLPRHASGEKKDVMTAVIVSTAAIRTYSAATERRNHRPLCTGPWTRAGPSRHLFAAASPISTAKPTTLAMSNSP